MLTIKQKLSSSVFNTRSTRHARPEVAVCASDVQFPPSTLARLFAEPYYWFPWSMFGWLVGGHSACRLSARLPLLCI
jgi:hypothetical protein